jgi:hypothetical protein
MFDTATKQLWMVKETGTVKVDVVDDTWPPQDKIDLQDGTWNPLFIQRPNTRKFREFEPRKRFADHPRQEDDRPNGNRPGGNAYPDTSRRPQELPRRVLSPRPPMHDVPARRIHGVSGTDSNSKIWRPNSR